MSSKFEATAALQGYIYQCLFALLEAVKRAKRDPTFEVALEVLDDIEFSPVGGQAVEVLQLKYHQQRREADLSDYSSDIWKSLRIWCEGYCDGTIPDDISLYLITTARAPENSAAAYLGANNRDVEAARNLLDSVAVTSKSQNNAAGYAAYRALDADDRKALLERVVIVDLAPDILMVKQSLLDEVAWAAPSREQRPTVVGYLEGWWLNRVVEAICSKPAGRIGGIECEKQIDKLRREFQPDNLPVDHSLYEVQINEEGYRDKLFVQQLQMIEIRDRRALNAMKDHYRASTHRSRWLRENLLEPGELGTYESRLTEKWDLHFGAMRDECGDESPEEQKRCAGRKLYLRMQDSNIPIRNNLVDEFVCHGSYHILADSLKVGWHCDYEARLRKVLEGKS